MHDHDTTSGSPEPDVEAEVERVIREAAEQKLTFNGCLRVTLIELPYALGKMHPICGRITADGEHPIPTPYVLRDEDTQEVYCRLRCAAEESVDRAITIAKDEHIYPAEVTQHG